MTTERTDRVDGPNGDAREMTIVIGDLVGSTALIAKSGHLTFTRALEEYFRQARGLLEEHGGRMVKGLGEGFLAVFEEAKSATAFALALQRSLAERPIRVGESSLAFRVGIHAGLVHLRATSYGEDLFGEAVNLAARLSATAGPGEIVISASAREALSDDQRAGLGPTEQFVVKGRLGPVEINRVGVARA